jgi:hypothetical protein
MRVGEAATKFSNPNVHVKTVRILEKKAADAITSGLPHPSNYRCRNWPPQIGDRITIKSEPMGFDVGSGFYSINVRSSRGVAPLSPTGNLNHATGVFEFKGLDVSGNPIFDIISAYPDLT